MPFGIGQAFSGLHKVVFARRHSKHEQRLSAGSGVTPRVQPSNPIHRNGERTTLARRVVTRCAYPEEGPRYKKTELHKYMLERPLPVQQATKDQAEAIHDLFGVLVAALHHDTDVHSILQQQLELAAEAGILSCWPFAAVSAKEQSLAAMTHSLADLVHVAYNLQRLDNLLPALYQLMQLFPDVSPDHSEALLSVLELLAEAYGKLRVSSNSNTIICSILGLWGFNLDQVIGPFNVWNSRTVSPGADFFLPRQQLQRKCTSLCDVSAFAAVQILEDTADNLTGTIELDSSYLPPRRSAAKFWTLDEEELMSSHESSPAVADAYRLVSSTRAEQPLQAPPPGDQYMTRAEHNQVLMTLGHGPHGCHAIQAYLKRHSNRFLFDFNERILEATAERRRQASMESEDDLHA